MSNKSYIWGVAFAVVGAIFLAFDYQAPALYWSLCAIGMWLDGVCLSLKK